MGQFKPMVKMTTSEPSVMLKMKKGGHAKMPKMAMGGTPGYKKMSETRGALEALADTPALIGRPAVNAPVRAPGKPSMAERRKAMAGKMEKPPMASTKPTKPMGMPSAAKPSMSNMPAAAMPSMKAKEGGSTDKAQDKAMIKKAFKQHDMQEHKGGKGTKLALKKGGMADCYAEGGQVGHKPLHTPATAEPTKNTINREPGEYAQTAMRTAKPRADQGKTGEVKESNAGGYATGGVVNGNGGGFATGGVAMKNAGGYATGGVAMSNAGGFKKGGASKKFARGGSVIDDGKAEAMPQGSKAAPAPKTQVNLSGTYKKGGSVVNKKLHANFESENSHQMKDAKTMSRLQYKTSEGSGPMNKAPRFQ